MKSLLLRSWLALALTAGICAAGATLTLAVDIPIGPDHGKDDGSVADATARTVREIADLEARLAELKPMILNPRPDQDPILLTEEYLHTALQAVYFGKFLANMRDYNVGGTQDLVSLVDAGILKAWPENPLDNWQPMGVVAPTDGFAAGELCVDYCPLEYYSNVGTGPEPVSFQLYIYGITPGQGAFQDVMVLGWNKKWAQVPPNVLYGMSFTCSPDNEPKYKAILNPETGKYDVVKDE